MDNNQELVLKQDRKKIKSTGQGKIAKRFPFTVYLEEGKEYFYCTCGLGGSQPFCDGECQGTGLHPVRICPRRSGNALLCGCKRQVNRNNPSCDGTHSTINLDW